MWALVPIKEPINALTKRKQGELLQYLTFKLIDENYGVDVIHIKEVLLYSAMTSV